MKKYITHNKYYINKSFSNKRKYEIQVQNLKQQLHSMYNETLDLNKANK